MNAFELIMGFSNSKSYIDMLNLGFYYFEVKLLKRFLPRRVCKKNGFKFDLLSII